MDIHKNLVYTQITNLIKNAYYIEILAGAFRIDTCYNVVYYIYVTGLAKTLHLHTSDFSALVTHNSRTIKDIAVKFLHIVQQ